MAKGKTFEIAAFTTDWSITCLAETIFQKVFNISLIERMLIVTYQL